MQIQLVILEQAFPVTLDANATGRDLIELLPLALTLEDYAATEKIARLPRRLSIAGAPAGIDPEPGDLAYYAPWGNLAIFYEDFGHSAGLIRLGRIRSGIDAFRAKHDIAVRIEAVPR